MKNFIKYLTFTGYIMSQTIGFAGPATSGPRLSTRKEVELAAKNYNDALAAYYKIGPQGLVDGAKLALDGPDHQFIFSKLQSKDQTFPTLPHAELAKNANEMQFKVSDKEIWTLRAVDLDRGLFELNGKKFHLDRKASFAANYAEMQKTVNEARKAGAHASVQPSVLELMEHRIAQSIENMFFPRAEAQMMTYLVIGAIVIAALIGAFMWGKSSQKTQDDTDRQARADARAAARAADPTHIVYSGTGTTSGTSTDGATVTKD